MSYMSTYPFWYSNSRQYIFYIEIVQRFAKHFLLPKQKSKILSQSDSSLTYLIKADFLGINFINLAFAIEGNRAT